jgi:hypothetical protein
MRIETNELEAFRKQLHAKNYKYAKPNIEDTPWGSKDMAIKDPFGNRLVFTSSVGG